MREKLFFKVLTSKNVPVLHIVNHLSPQNTLTYLTFFALFLYRKKQLKTITEEDRPSFFWPLFILFILEYFFTEYKSQSTYFPRDETRLVCLPTQLERTLQLYW